MKEPGAVKVVELDAVDAGDSRVVDVDREDTVGVEADGVGDGSGADGDAGFVFSFLSAEFKVGEDVSDFLR